MEDMPRFERINQKKKSRTPDAEKRDRRHKKPRNRHAAL